MVSNYVIVTIKLYLDAGNGEYIIVWNFGRRIVSGFEVRSGDPRFAERKKIYRKSTIKPPSQISPLLLICTLLLCRVESLPRLY